MSDLYHHATPPRDPVAELRSGFYRQPFEEQRRRAAQLAALGHQGAVRPTEPRRPRAWHPGDEPNEMTGFKFVLRRAQGLTPLCPGDEPNEMTGFKFVLRRAQGLTPLCQQQTYTPGHWLEAVGPLRPGHNGVHFLPSASGVLGFMLGESAVTRAELWVCEAQGVATPRTRAERSALGSADGGVQVFAAVARRARLLRPAWDERIARSLACDLAALVLSVWEAVAPRDDRPRRAVEGTRRTGQPQPALAQLALMAALGPSGATVGGWRDASRARWAALAASRCAEVIPPGSTPGYLVKATLLAALDAGAEWSACVACAERALAPAAASAG